MSQVELDGTTRARVQRDTDAFNAYDDAWELSQAHARFRERVDPSGNPEAARLIALYRDRRGTPPAASPGRRPPLARIGALAWQVPDALAGALDFTGRCLAAVRGAVVAPRSVDWRSLPALVQSIGADGLPVAAAANLLVGHHRVPRRVTTRPVRRHVVRARARGRWRSPPPRP